MMTGNLDLEVDTESIRRAASILDGVARQFLAAAATSGRQFVADASLGQSNSAASAAALVNLRCEQADGAAAQLGSISTGLADRLRLTAVAFEQLEAALAVFGR